MQLGTVKHLLLIDRNKAQNDIVYVPPLALVQVLMITPQQRQRAPQSSHTQKLTPTDEKSQQESTFVRGPTILISVQCQASITQA